jgi:hypothetical protein
MKNGLNPLGLASNLIQIGHLGLTKMGGCGAFGYDSPQKHLRRCKSLRNAGKH